MAIRPSDPPRSAFCRVPLNEITVRQMTCFIGEFRRYGCAARRYRELHGTTGIVKNRYRGVIVIPPITRSQRPLRPPPLQRRLLMLGTLSWRRVGRTGARDAGAVTLPLGRQPSAPPRSLCVPECDQPRLSLGSVRRQGLSSHPIGAENSPPRKKNFSLPPLTKHRSTPRQRLRTEKYTLHVIDASAGNASTDRPIIAVLYRVTSLFVTCIVTLTWHR